MGVFLDVMHVYADSTFDYHPAPEKSRSADIKMGSTKWKPIIYACNSYLFTNISLRTVSDSHQKVLHLATPRTATKYRDEFFMNLIALEVLDQVFERYKQSCALLYAVMIRHSKFSAIYRIDPGRRLLHA